MKHSGELRHIYDRLYNRYGPQNWWPGETRDEIIIGTILTQNTNWKNVEKALRNLKKSHLLSLEKILHTSEDTIAQCIRSSGYYNQKASRLKTIADFFHINNYNIFHDLPVSQAREKLLNISGIGPETADSILLYVFEKPVFVIDTYTKRLFHRLGYFPEQISYDDAQDLFMKSIEKNHIIYNEFHALIVRHAKEYCQKIPRCIKCALSKKCTYDYEML